MMEQLSLTIYHISKKKQSQRDSFRGCAKTRMVESSHNDNTVVIFRCGKFETIAVRHRGNQTLYISDLIDVAHCKNPEYGKLHIVLYISIMHDILDRTQQRPKENDVVQGKKRRHVEKIPGPKIKRPRTRALVAKLEADEIEHEKACNYLTSDKTCCDLLLLRMSYGVYNSPCPSFFLRSGRPQRDSSVFEPHEYISVTLNSEIAAGATGVVHEATLKFLSDKGKVHMMPVVVKFSMKRDQQKRLRHEYAIYQHLASSYVKGVPRVIGLFEDQNSDMIALVMTHTGTSLSSLYPGEIQLVVQDPQRSAFLHVMSNIHTVGIRHHDIRPENLTIDDQGRVFIIDFDMAEISPTEGAKSRELSHLTEL
ncbi:kinase-like domain-containing protein [Collybia nuda]|uniref:Kinase-like domain-containing protein n=1 Tax=Collybia nuda TaxID=64659 RepID=A0A9P5Y2D8_9AGAR|nr:kinase-like domain-containing protein [Collybia nuda]